MFDHNLPPTNRLVMTNSTWLSHQVSQRPFKIHHVDLVHISLDPLVKDGRKKGAVVLRQDRPLGNARSVARERTGKHLSTGPLQGQANGSMLCVGITFHHRYELN